MAAEARVAGPVERGAARALPDRGVGYLARRALGAEEALELAALASQGDQLLELGADPVVALAPVAVELQDEAAKVEQLEVAQGVKVVEAPAQPLALAPTRPTRRLGRLAGRGSRRGRCGRSFHARGARLACCEGLRRGGGVTLASSEGFRSGAFGSVRGARLASRGASPADALEEPHDGEGAASSPRQAASIERPWPAWLAVWPLLPSECALAIEGRGREPLRTFLTVRVWSRDAVGRRLGRGPLGPPVNELREVPWHIE